MASHPDRVAATLLGAYAGAKRVPVDADSQTLALADAMGVQGAVAAGLGVGVTAWKVAVPDGTNPAYAPMFDNVVKASGSSWRIPEEGFNVEIELALRLKAGLPRRAEPYTRAEIEAAVSDLVVGIELVGSRFQKSPGAAPFPAWLADNLGNGAYIIGEHVPFVSGAHASALRVQYWIDGALQLDQVGGHPQNDVITPLLLCANAQTDAFGGFKAGDLITTGCLHKPHPVGAPASIKATIEGVGSVETHLVQ
jgi:2-keto-4-pentenoate hydratase